MGDYSGIILIALIGFLIVAFLLLAPVYRFLDREEKRSQQWTDDVLARTKKPVSSGSRSDQPQNGHPA